MENHGVVTNEDLAGCGLMRRQTAVVALGWRPLRFTWDDVVKDPYGTAAAVERALAA